MSIYLPNVLYIHSIHINIQRLMVSHLTLLRGLKLLDKELP